MRPVIILTRPAPASGSVAQQLRDKLGDVDVIVAPLLDIRPITGLPPLERYKALIFTSANGVDQFCAQSERRDLPCFAVGEATAARAKEHGLSAEVFGPDAAGMIRTLLAKQVKGPLLHLRGAHARGDIAENLTFSGCQTDDAVIYEQWPVALSDQAKAALTKPNSVIVPLYSPRTARLFAREHAGQAPLFVAALSSAVAQEVAGLEMRMCMVADKPEAGVMLDCIIALYKAALWVEGSDKSK